MEEKKISENLTQILSDNKIEEEKKIEGNNDQKSTINLKHIPQAENKTQQNETTAKTETKKTPEEREQNAEKELKNLMSELNCLWPK